MKRYLLLQTEEVDIALFATRFCKSHLSSSLSLLSLLSLQRAYYFWGLSLGEESCKKCAVSHSSQSIVLFQVRNLGIQKQRRKKRFQTFLLLKLTTQTSSQTITNEEIPCFSSEYISLTIFIFVHFAIVKPVTDDKLFTVSMITHGIEILESFPWSCHLSLSFILGNFERRGIIRFL